MDLVDKLSPADVLSHLRDMGYHNISPHQLKEFVTDLKKLIIHDQLSSCSGSSSSTLSSSSSSESDYFSTNETLSNSSGDSTRLFDNERLRLEQQNYPQSRNRYLSCQVQSKPASAVSSRCTMKRSSFSSSSLSQNAARKENLPPRRERTKSISEQNMDEITKPKTSFIRSWKLQGQQALSQKPAHKDPVKLYHQYQSYWAKYKCPGEDSRADLRWLIREKMLGQDPHLYSKNGSVKKIGR